MVANQVRRVHIHIDRVLSVSATGKRAALTPFMRERGMDPSSLGVLLISNLLGRGSPELLQEKAELSRSASLVDTKMMLTRVMRCKYSSVSRNSLSSDEHQTTVHIPVRVAGT